MKTTHIFYERCIPDEFVQSVRKVLGPSIVHPFDDLPEDTDNNLFVFMLPLEEEIIRMHDFSLIVPNHSAVLFVGSDLNLYHELLQKIPKETSYVDFIDFNQIETAEKLVRLRRFLTDSTTMPADLLNEKVTEMIHSHNTCTLCTGYGTHVRATPIEYTYVNGAFYFLTEGGEKFANLLLNPTVSIAIYHEFSGFDKLEGIQVSGTASSVPLFSDEYKEVVTFRKLSPEQLKKMPVALHMIKVIPDRMEVLCSGFHKDGFEPKQVRNL